LSHQDGLTVLFTTHHPHHALAVADNALLMLGGAKYASGPASEVLNEENLHALYGVDIKLLPFEHNGEMRRTLVPVLPFTAPERT
jgi:iron complex transport system ATP-binding protein